MSRVPTAEELAKINEHARTPFTEEDLYIFDDLMVDTLPVSHGFRLSSKLLETFSQDISKGIGLLLAHDSGTLPVGKCFAAELRKDFIEETGEYVDTLYGTHYIPIGSRARKTMSNMTTEDIAAGLDDGTIEHTSIGFKFRKITCNICGEDYRGWGCYHSAGNTYEVEGDDGVFREKVCTPVAGEDGVGELLENSLVYKGASSRASVIDKFTAHSNDSKNTSTPILSIAEDIKGLPTDESLYLMYSSDGPVFMATEKAMENRIPKPEEGGTLKDEGGNIVMSKPENQTTLAENLVTAREELNAKVEEVSKLQTQLTYKDEELANKDTEITKLASENAKVLAEFEEFKEEVAELKSNVSIIEEFSEDLRSKILEEGVRAFGNSFDKDMWGKFISTQSLKELTETHSKLKKDVEEKFKGSSDGKVSKEPSELNGKLGIGVQEYLEDFETEAEYSAYVADIALKNCKADSTLELGEETKRVYAKYLKR